MSADKTYIGISAGLQADYRFSDFFGANLSADYAQGKAGARDYVTALSTLSFRYDGLF